MKTTRTSDMNSHIQVKKIFDSQELRVSRNFLHLMLKVKLWVLEHFGAASRQRLYTLESQSRFGFVKNIYGGVGDQTLECARYTFRAKVLQRFSINKKSFGQKNQNQCKNN